MRSSIERLRLGLLVGAALLVAVIAGFLGYARYRAHRILKDLPGMLGATITKEFNGYTYSQSLKGKTVFTMHAAKAVERKDGTYTLHDVAMTMYGRSGDRDDHISGTQFEYDEKAGIVRAVGVVHLDLQAADSGKGAGESKAQSAKASRVIHVTTSGLIYTQKLGVAATPDAIEFVSNGLRGHAVGAEYDADTGHVVLQSAVRVEGEEQGRTVLLTASHAELDREAEVADLVAARYSSQGETAESDKAQVHLRADGSADRVVGEGHVRLSRPEQGAVTAERMDVAVDAGNKPQRAVLERAVRYVDHEALREAEAAADEAVLRFDGAGRVEHVSLVGRKASGSRAGQSAVTALETLRGDSSVREVLSRRSLTADTVELSLVADQAGKAVLREATAKGAAKLSVTGPAGARAGGKMAGKRLGELARSVSGDVLTAQFVERDGVTEITSLDGMGGTAIEQVDAAGVDELSRAPRLAVKFQQAARSRGAAARVGSVELATAVQEGGVEVTRSTPPAGAAEASSVNHATAERAVYDGGSNRLTLMERVRVTDAASVLSADRVETRQASGDAVAAGNVKVTYLEDGGAEAQPVHVLAAWATFQRAAGVATFYGMGAGAGAAEGDASVLTAAGPKLARMWQPGLAASSGAAAEGGSGGSQVEAPMLVFQSQPQQKTSRAAGQMVRLTARGDGPGAAMAVRAVLVSVAAVRADGGGPGAAAGSARVGAMRSTGQSKVSGGTRVIRLSSREMVYTDATRLAEFTGGVHVVEGDAVLQAAEAKVYLAPATAAVHAPAPVRSGVMPGGSVDRIVATGGIEIRQPGRLASGERLVYTARDQMFVLTGTRAAPPKVVSASQGTATGVELRFHTGDDSVVIAGGDGSAGAEKAHTETRVKK